MSKNLLTLITILFIACFTACRQENPTRIDSTQHQPEQPKTTGEHSTNANGSVKTEEHNTSHREPVNDNSMNHSAMQSAPNAAAQAYDLQFLDTMIAHHEGAVEMGKAAEMKTQNPELKRFAAQIVTDQTREIAQMKRWREQWFAGKPSALNMEMTGMADSMKGMDMTKMNTASGKAFDDEFVNQMTPHHMGAIVMAREALTKAEHAEIKALANQIIQAQEAEMRQMAKWLAH